MRITLDGDTKSSPQSQVCNFQSVCAVVHQKVLGFEVSVHHSMLVTVCYSLQQLVQEILRTTESLRDYKWSRKYHWPDNGEEVNI